MTTFTEGLLRQELDFDGVHAHDEWQALFNQLRSSAEFVEVRPLTSTAAVGGIEEHWFAHRQSRRVYALVEPDLPGLPGYWAELNYELRNDGTVEAA